MFAARRARRRDGERVPTHLTGRSRSRGRGPGRELVDRGAAAPLDGRRAARAGELGPRVVLGVCGGIAAYKAVEVCRLLVDAGVHVIPVLTSEATRFVGAVTFSALASEPAQTSLWDEDTPIPHTRLGQSADLIVVAPATAHLLARYAAGLSDDLLDGDAAGHAGAGAGLPGHAHRNVGAPVGAGEPGHLGARGASASCLRPWDGLAGGDSGEGRLADPARHRRARPGRPGTEAVGPAAGVAGDLAGLRVVVRAGGTREATRSRPLS